ncbi:MAG: large subunit ribosomal protein [Thermoleophilaceae bacterium]|nr:large subunit ribosomal protein [Thermoleophilaceae bacterium]
MNREQKAAVIDEVAADIEASDAIFAVDYRGISVTQVAELRGRLAEADASLRVVKNTLTERAADKAGADALKVLLEGPTALTFVKGDVALAAKAIATFRRANEVPQFKGGTLGGEALSVEQLESLARLPAREVLYGQFVGVLASPITGLVRGLNGLISGLAIQLQAIADQGLVGSGASAAPAPEDSAQSTEDGAEGAAPAEDTPSEAPGDPVAEAEAAEADAPETSETSEAPSEGDTEQEG